MRSSCKLIGLIATLVAPTLVSAQTLEIGIMQKLLTQLPAK